MEAVCYEEKGFCDTAFKCSWRTVVFNRLVMWIIHRKMSGKAAIAFSGKTIATILYGIFSTLVFGAGMCMIMVWNLMVWGIVVGVVGIILLLFLIPICRGLK